MLKSEKTNLFDWEISYFKTFIQLADLECQI